MHRFRHLLVGLADRPADDELIDYVRQIVDLGTARGVHFLHALDGLPPDARPAALQRARARVAQAFPETAGLDVTFEVASGSREDGLLTTALERKSDVIVVGHGKASTGRKALARRLAMKAPCSVWMVPEGAPPPRRLLVPVDYSEPSADALAVAADLVRLRGAGELFTLHVYTNDLVVFFEEYPETLRREEEALLRAFDDRVAGLGVAAQPLVEQGADVAAAVLRVAEQRGIDLIVMSTRGRSSSASVLLGSATEDLITRTRLPLLAVKHFGAKLGLVRALLSASERVHPRYN